MSISDDTALVNRYDLSKFLQTCFRHCTGLGGYVSLRTFREGRPDLPAFNIEGVPVADLARVEDRAFTRATEAAAASDPVVFAPPVALFDNDRKAGEANVLAAPVLTVDLDAGDPAAALAVLEGVLGKATLVIATGGLTADGDDRLHAHWRLTQPAQGGDIAKLKIARKQAAELADGDASGAPCSHPFRWPGSVHRKAAPAPSRIIRADDTAEIDLDMAIGALQSAADLMGVGASAAQATAPAQEHLLAPGDEGQRKRLLLLWLASVPNTFAYDTWLSALAGIRAAAGPDLADDPDIIDAAVHWSDQYRTDTAAHHARYTSALPGPYKAGWNNHLRPLADEAGATAPLVAEAQIWFQPHPLPGEPFGAALKADEVDDEWETASDLAGTIPPPRDWVVPDWLPAGSLTVLFGRGGIGKTLLAQQLASCVAGGHDFLGCSVSKPGPVLAIYGEDTSDKLARRQHDMSAVLGWNMAGLSGVQWSARAGKENLLAVATRDGVVQPTKLYHRLRQRVARTGARLVIVDNLAQTFGGNENDRSQVTQYGNLLGGIAADFGCAVLLLGHPAKAEDSQYSGSTAWDAVARSRWFFTRPDSDTASADHRVLRRSKSNYASFGAEIPCRYQGGALLALYSAAQAAGMSQADADQQTFLDALDQLTGQGQSVAPSAAARERYAPKRMSNLPSVQAAGLDQKRLERAMLALQAGGFIQVVQERTQNRKSRDAIERTGRPFVPVAAGAGRHTKVLQISHSIPLNKPFRGAPTPCADPARGLCANPAPSA